MSTATAITCCSMAAMTVGAWALTNYEVDERDQVAPSLDAEEIARPNV
jgi:hypothetical protein